MYYVRAYATNSVGTSYGETATFTTLGQAPSVVTLPAKWHVSTDDEWTILVNYLGGVNIAGGKMKLPGLAFWLYPNTGADNSSGFSGISGGLRGIDGGFFNGPGAFWTSTSENVTNARDWFLVGWDASVTRYYDKKGDGFNVRCVKD